MTEVAESPKDAIINDEEFKKEEKFGLFGGGSKKVENHEELLSSSSDSEDENPLQKFDQNVDDLIPLQEEDKSDSDEEMIK